MKLRSKLKHSTRQTVMKTFRGGGERDLQDTEDVSCLISICGKFLQRSRLETAPSTDLSEPCTVRVVKSMM